MDMYLLLTKILFNMTIVSFKFKISAVLIVWIDNFVLCTCSNI